MTSARSTPPSRARSTTASRSSAKASSARWQWESITSPDARSGRRRLLERDDDRFAAVGAGREHHAVRFNPHQLCRLEIEDDDAGFSNEGVGLVRLGDAGDQGPLLAPGVHLQLEKLVRLRHALGCDDSCNAQLDFHELVDREAVAACRRRLTGRRGNWRRVIAHGCGLLLMSLITGPQRSFLFEDSLAIRAP